MPSTVERLVSPKLPTALADQASLDLPGHDLWLFFMTQVNIIPAKLDIPKFEDALSKTLQLYPHFAGHIRSNNDRWSIELTNTPLPVEIEHRLGVTSDAFLDGNWVVQPEDNISVFLNHQFINPIPADGYSPLVRLKLTFFDNETSIGISWHHALGDAILIYHFVHTLSQFYQDLPLEYPPPTFGKYHFPTPSADVTAEYDVPHLRVTCPRDEFFSVYADSFKGIEHLRYQMDNRDLEELRSVLSTRGHKNGYLSKQDCFSALVVAVLSHHSIAPVQKVLNVSSFRGLKLPFTADNVAGNMFQTVLATVPPDMAGIATALRDALVRSRQPEFIHSKMSAKSDVLLEHANTGKIFVINRYCDDKTVAINSNLGIDWCNAHFGYPDGTRFYTDWVGKNIFRCFRSNPVKGEDGVWRARQAAEISMGVKAELAPKLRETFACGFQYILDSKDAKA